MKSGGKVGPNAGRLAYARKLREQRKHQSIPIEQRLEALKRLYGKPPP